MSADSKKELLKTIKQRKYLNKDFEGFKNDLFEYARIHYPDKIQDFSDPSLGGMFLELAAYIGDVQSFYLDHQFHELDPITATEFKNIERHLKNSDVRVGGASPAVVDLELSIQVPADTSVTPPVPLNNCLPVIKAGSTFKSNNGILFETLNDVDFAKTINNEYVADIRIGTKDPNNMPTSFIMTATATAISGQRDTESFTVNGFESFKKITLSKPNVTQIIYVGDSFGKEYYEVDYLTQDTVYKPIINFNYDREAVQERLVVVPAPYRFTKNISVQTKLTTLNFGGGNAQSLNDDIIPDPSEFSLPLYGKRTLSRFTLNPGNLLQTQTLGVVSPNSTITVQFRHGGGLNHNVSENSIRGSESINMNFPLGPSAANSQFVRKSLNVTNPKSAQGGEDPLSINDLKNLIPASRAAQSRIVTKEDLLARIYTMPSNFGRVYRASIHSNPNNPLASQLFIISRNTSNQLVTSSDSLKKNLETYLNSYRMISDAIDILDARIINLKIEFSILCHPDFNNNLVIQNILFKLKSYFKIANVNIDQPIILSDLQNLIYNNLGVVSVNSIEIKNLSNRIGQRTYADTQFDVTSNIYKGILTGPPGSIFEIRYPDFDIEGTAI